MKIHVGELCKRLAIGLSGAGRRIRYGGGAYFALCSLANANAVP